MKPLMIAVVLFPMLFAGVAMAQEPVATPVPETTAVVPDSQPTEEALPALDPDKVLDAAKDKLPDGVDTDDIVGTTKVIIESFKGGAWTLGVGLILMLITSLLKKVLSPLLKNTNWLPWVTIGVGTLAVIFVSIGVGVTWYAAIPGGIAAGLAACGGYSAFGRHIGNLFKKKD